MTYEWMSSTKRKVHQRAINRAVRNFNKQIEEDNLWRGRFFIRQADESYWRVYEDKSGGELLVKLRFFDKKNMLYVDYYENVNCWLSGRLWVTANKFITEDIDVWGGENPRDDNTDYRNLDKDYVVGNAKPKFDYPFRAHI